MVARLTPDQKVACSNHVAVTLFFTEIPFLQDTFHNQIIVFPFPGYHYDYLTAAVFPFPGCHGNNYDYLSAATVESKRRRQVDRQRLVGPDSDSIGTAASLSRASQAGDQRRWKKYGESSTLMVGPAHSWRAVYLYSTHSKNRPGIDWRCSYISIYI